MNVISEVTEKYLKLYRKILKEYLERSSAYINSFREDAFEKFSELGIPTKKNEAYKYTNLNIFFDHDYNNLFHARRSRFQ